MLVGYDCVLGFYNLFFTMISMLKTNGKIMFVGQIGSYHWSCGCYSNAGRSWNILACIFLVAFHILSRMWFPFCSFHFLMNDIQNWAFLTSVLEQLNCIPSKQHGTDIMRIRKWYVDSFYYFFNVDWTFLLDGDGGLCSVICRMLNYKILDDVLECIVDV